MEKWRKEYKFQPVLPIQFWLDEHIDDFVDAKETTNFANYVEQLFERRWVYLTLRTPCYCTEGYYLSPAYNWNPEA
jgi:hypothetical protein